MSEQKPDYYRELNVLPTANSVAIHRAYRERARRVHPDVVGDDTAMKRLNEAWEVLRSPARRAAYDRERAMEFRDTTLIQSMPAQPAGPPPGGAFGPVLEFGRYAGWSLGEVAQVDPEFLRWLYNAAIGRTYRRAIESVFDELAVRPHTLRGRRAAFQSS